MFRTLHRLLIGKPLSDTQMAHEQMPKWKALSIFSSDALSSVGYGPEQIAVTLAIPGMLLYGYFSYAAIAVLLLLAIVTISYSQVARANPGGGGSYSVAKTNLGEMPALVAGAALFCDYVLTVAVSISSGTEAFVSAFPILLGHEVSLDLFVLFVILMIINLRGLRESSNVFTWPTYFFVLGIFVTIGAGLWQTYTGIEPLIPLAAQAKQNMDWAVLLLVLRAFANGCSSMTGVEAIANGVPMFRAPAVSNAIKTTFMMAGLLATMLGGICFLIIHFHLLPRENVTMLSQLVELVFGRGFMYYYVQLTTMLVLYLAANTAYNGLPPLLSLLARDGYMPRYLNMRGERLSFSNGIVLLSMAAGSLIFFFNGNVEHLISLYAIGVFLSFTIAQSGMVVHWYRTKEKNWQLLLCINAFGTLITGLVVLIIAFSKFTSGAWLVLVLIPIMIFCFKKIRCHYNDIADQLHLAVEEYKDSQSNTSGRNIVIIPVASPTHIVAESIRYAKLIGNGQVYAVHVAVDAEAGQKVAKKWAEWDPDVKLVVMESPYRQLAEPLLRFIANVRRHKNPEDFITVLIPEFRTKKWWHRLLHNQSGMILRFRLFVTSDVIVTTVPYRLHK